MALIMKHPLLLVSMAVCVLIVIGLVKRSQRRIHISMMLTALVIDLSLVLYLEVQRGVVESVPAREITPLLIVHIILSVVVLALYGVQLYTGVKKKLKNLPCPLHKKTGVLFVITRFGNLITSILVMSQQ